MTEEQPPLMLCLENAAGEEVSLNIEPNDDFHSFLIKANELLGYEVDLNSLTRNKPVALTDNIYQFLLNSENGLLEYPMPQTFDQMLEPNDATDALEYVLGDGTQIKASQIHFDNEDPPFDFVAEKIPFVKYVDDYIDDVEPSKEISTKIINIVASPVSKLLSTSSPKKPFINSIPFKLVNNNASGFAAQFHKFVESSIDKTFTPLNPVTTRNKSPRSLIRDNYNKYEDNIYNKTDFITRDEVLNMFKDTPVVPYESQSFSDKRRRKTDPSRPINKTANAKTMPYIDVDGTLIGQNESQNCFICEKFVNNNMDKLYLFDNEDQKLHRSSPQKKLSTQLKIICEQCLDNNFKPSRLKSPSKNLNPDEYLVIRNNQQYIFQKTNSIDFKNIKSSFVNIGEATAIIDKIETEILKGNQVKQTDFVKVEIDSNGEIISKDDAKESNSESYIFKDGSSSDVEIIEGPEIDDVIDNLEEADEEVKEFLGMYQSDNNDTSELKCRFCERVFAEFAELMEHGDVHKHVTEDGEVYPCPLCFYGYANFKWLKGHLKAAHDKPKKPPAESNNDDAKDESQTPSEQSPVAKRTRSNSKKNNEGDKDEAAKSEEDPAKSVEPENDNQERKMEIKLEIKQEALDTSDEEAIWIVHTEDTPADQLHSLLHGDEKTEDAVFKKPQKCAKCSQITVDMSTHKCKRRARKRKCLGKDEHVTLSSQKDPVKRPLGRPRQGTDSGENDLLVPRPRNKKKATEPTSDPQIMTCHNCNESYTSKVRLKFHMQFHDNTEMLTANGQYTCLECPGVAFTTETELFDHVHFQHDKQNRYQCPVKDCGKTFFLRASLTKHSRTHTDTRRYVCGTCGKRFLDKQTLDEHGVTHLQIKPYQCHICMKQLTRRSRLRMHMRAHEESLCPALVPVCAACRRAFQNVPAAVEHVKKSPECLGAFSCDLNEDEKPTAVLSPTSGLVRPTLDAEPPGQQYRIEREAQCAGAAALLAPLPASLRTVVRAVTVDKAFRCEFCEDVFYLEEDLNKHRAIHKGVKNPFTCHICKVSFATYSRCTTHKTTHGFYKRSLADVKSSGPSRADCGPSARGVLGYGGFPVVKHFLCEDCGRSYLHWTYLQVHRRMKHANDNFIYKCIHCEETFPNSWSVAYHRKKVHGKPTEKGTGATKTVHTDYRIPCRDCDEVLPNKTALYKHRKKEHSYVSLPIHDNQGIHILEVHGQDTQYPTSRSHTCTVCGHVFRTASMLTEHSRIHTGERPFPCDVCGVAFRRATAMRNHRLIHTGVRAWGCTRCPKRFRIRSDLNTHSRLKHPLHLAVIEVPGLEPSPEQVLQALAVNNIARERVLEITKVSFPKGSCAVVPDCARALAQLPAPARRAVPQPAPVCHHDNYAAAEMSTPYARRGRGIARNSRFVVPPSQVQDLTGLNVEMVFQDNLLEQPALSARQMLDPRLLFNTPPQQMQTDGNH
ncbi:zinc finger protein Xfin [Cydia amplana]|uniref:zinc finger protein Xfin n=1 Tax=Cydia amplana TaxID=1869771 RepID=UPI002FE5B6FD